MKNNPAMVKYYSTGVPILEQWTWVRDSPHDILRKLFIKSLSVTEMKSLVADLGERIRRAS